MRPASPRSCRWCPPWPWACFWSTSPLPSRPTSTPSSCSSRQAGWHGSRQLRVLTNVTLVPLPPYAPELNFIERVWLLLREQFLS
ncbi:transposase [Muricoccus nepalensis]|uniref:transposase n=1 Tax=Muricoccus nepalensis TaxID=1854500 RepID=UPI0030C7F086